MALPSIAGAPCAGKSAFDRVGILRDAHHQARRLLTYGCFRGTYRQALAAGLRLAWRGAKAEREEAEWQAKQPPIPAGIVARADAIRADAWWEPITAAGHERMVAAFRAADALLEPYRLQL